MSASQNPIKVEYSVGTGATFPTNSQVAVTTPTIPPVAPPVVINPLTTYNADGTVFKGSEGYGQVQATTTSTTVNLVGQAQFTVGYYVSVQDATGLTYATITAQALTSFTFTSIVAHVYRYITKGV